MRFEKMLYQRLLVPILTVLLFACGASHRLTNNIEYHDTVFSYDQLKTDGLIFGGISSQFVKLTPEQRLDYSAIISHSLLEKLKDVQLIRLTNPVQLIDKIGKAKYLSIMESFDFTQKLPDTTQVFLRDTLTQAKYLLMAYIVNENVIDDSFSEHITENNQEKIETEYQKTYFLTVEFQIYDLYRQRIVFRNTIFNTATNTDSRTTRAGCVESCMDELIQTILFGSPADIDREEVLEKIADSFAKDLPKKAR